MVKIHLTLARVEKGGERGDRANKSYCNSFHTRKDLWTVAAAGQKVSTGRV